MVKGAGGAFVNMNDLGRAIELAATRQEAAGNIYNIASLFLSWEEIGQAIIKLANSTSSLQLLDTKDWNGPAFLNEIWDLNCDKAAKDLGYNSLLSAADNCVAFSNALANCITTVIKEK